MLPNPEDAVVVVVGAAATPKPDPVPLPNTAVVVVDPYAGGADVVVAGDENPPKVGAGADVVVAVGVEENPPKVIALVGAELEKVGIVDCCEAAVVVVAGDPKLNP